MFWCWIWYGLIDDDGFGKIYFAMAYWYIHRPPMERQHWKPRYQQARLHWAWATCTLKIIKCTGVQSNHVYMYMCMYMHSKRATKVIVQHNSTITIIAFWYIHSTIILCMSRVYWIANEIWITVIIHSCCYIRPDNFYIWKCLVLAGKCEAYAVCIPW